MQELLMWLFGGLGATAVVSYLAERSASFQLLDTATKQMYKTVGATLIAVSAFALYTYVPAEFWATINPYWQVAVGVISVNYGTEVFHAFDRTLAKREEGEYEVEE